MFHWRRSKTISLVALPSGSEPEWDEFNVRTDGLTENVKNSMKMVDDLFTQAKGWKDFMLSLIHI